jgi:hypothetical protein
LLGVAGAVECAEDGDRGGERGLVRVGQVAAEGVEGVAEEGVVADPVEDGLELVEGVEAAGDFRGADEGGELAAGEAGRVLAAVDGLGESVELAFGEMCGEVWHGLSTQGAAHRVCARRTRLTARRGAFGAVIPGAKKSCENVGVPIGASRSVRTKPVEGAGRLRG